ncbi:MAG TPA: hypothetical protein VGC96_13200 [Candidatus Elarobacter sp.]|jgi:hypothetical protein
MAEQSFEQIVAAVNGRVEETGARVDAATANTAIWRRGDVWATLTAHDGGRLELTLHPAGDVPDVLEIDVRDADVVDMIAVPVANHLA